MATLDGFITSTKGVPLAITTSQEIRDRGSTFVGVLYKVQSELEAQNCIKYHRNVVHGSHKASHEISAWRCLTLKKGCTGLGGPDDFEVRSGCDDDGEDNGGRRALRTMESEGTIDAVVIVSRWFGGTLLGPVRFTHIETCTRDVCRTFRNIEDVEGYIEKLKDLDQELARLRTELNSARGLENNEESVDTSPRKIDYAQSLLNPPDLTKARRLLEARQRAVNSVKALANKQRNE